MLFNFIINSISCISFIFVAKNLKLITLKRKHSLSLFIILMLILYIMPIINVALIIPTVLLVMILFFISLKNTLMNSIISSTIIYLICNVVDFIFGSLFLKILKINIETLFSNQVVYLSLNLIIFIGSYFLSKFIGSLFQHYKDAFLFKASSKKFTMLLLINLISAFLIMYIFSVSIRMYIPDSSIAMLIAIISTIYFISSFVVIFFYGKYIKKDIELLQKEEESKQLKEYTDMIEHMYNDMRKFKHDYINLLGTINGYIEVGDICNLKDFFNDKIIPMSNEIDYMDSRLCQLQHLKIPPLKGLLSSKVVQAQNKELDVLVDIAEDIDLITVDILDLCRIIGVLFDNAIEASQLSIDRKLRLSFVKRNNSVIIIIKNSFPDNLPPIHKMFKKGFSTKGENRGIGLANVKEIVTNYNNVTLNTFIETNIFTQEINVLNHFS